MLSEITYRFTPLAFVALILGGCGVYTSSDRTISPDLNTSVVDERTKAPLKDVSVVMWSLEDLNARQYGVSDSKGMVRLPSLRGDLHISFLLIFPMDPAPAPALARFEKTGYVAKEINSQAEWQYFDGQKPVELAPLR